MNSLKKYFYILILFSVFIPFGVSAESTLFLTPSTGNYRVGESFSVLVNVNTSGESINASAGQINFDNSRLQVVSLGYSQSIFSLWTENPTFSNPAGTILFSGGVPSPGFIGASGSILRITFKVIAPGQAPVNFLSGSILANDGQGTNIAEGLQGALYSLIPSNNTAQPTVVPKDDSIKEAEKPIDAPILTEWPEKLNEGETLVVEGLGYPLIKIAIIIQKDLDEPMVRSTFSGYDGKFRFVYSEKVSAGDYRIWARNIAEDGNQSGLSDVANTRVVASTFFRIGGIVLSYATIIVTLVSLLLLILLLLLFVWFFYRRKKKKHGDELSEAEHALHQSFDTLKDGLSQYVTYLVNAKTPGGVKRRELKTKKELKEELENIEAKIRKEIEDLE